MISNQMLQIILIILTISLSITSCIVIINFIYKLKKSKISDYKSYKPFVSILIPARNEEKNIGNLLNSLMNQTYRNLEIIVLDDISTDSTVSVVSEYKDKIPIKLIHGRELPEGWKGKTWACHQLYKVSKGEILLFIDADVTLEKEAIQNAILNYKLSDVDLLSVFPTQKLNSISDYLVVPLMNWFLLTFLPMQLISRSKNEAFCAVNGQFVMINAQKYRKFGGHESVRNEIVEDMELGRLFKRKNLKVKSILDNGDITCHMYSSFNDSLNGFTKNFYPGTNLNYIIFILLITTLSIIYLLPILLIFWNKIFLIPVVLIIIQRILTSIISRQNVFKNLLLHIPQLFLLEYIALLSVKTTKSKKIKWKGRIYEN